MSDETPHELSPRRRRLMFRAWHRGTKEADLMIGRFVADRIADFTEAELDELESVLELPDVDLADWLSGRREIPAELRSPMLDRMALACAGIGAGLPEHLRPPASDDRSADRREGLDRPPGTASDDRSPDRREGLDRPREGTAG